MILIIIFIVAHAIVGTDVDAKVMLRLMWITKNDQEITENLPERGDTGSDDTSAAWDPLASWDMTKLMWFLCGINQ